jgi:hypothetical protein
VGDYKVEQDGAHITVYCEYRFYALGRFVRRAMGAGDYWTSNRETNYSDACEASESYALNRMAKFFNIAEQCWDSNYAAAWLKKYAHQVKDRKGNLVWKKKGTDFNLGEGGRSESTPPAGDKTQPPFDSASSPATPPAQGQQAPAPITRNKTARIRIKEAGKGWIAGGGSPVQVFNDEAGKGWRFMGADSIAVGNMARGAPDFVEVEYVEEKGPKGTIKVVVRAEVVSE